MINVGRGEMLKREFDEAVFHERCWERLEHGLSLEKTKKSRQRIFS